MQTNKPFAKTNSEIRNALLAHRSEHGLTNSSMAQRFSCSATFISKYLNDKLDHEIGDFEDRARDTLAAIDARIELERQLFPTSVSKGMAGRIDMARRTSDVCLISGDAGEGKTSGAQLYRAAHPSSLYWKSTGSARDAQQVQSGVFGLLHLKNYDYSKPRWNIIVEHLRGSGRALMIDNAHRLSRSGRDWCFDLNEETGIAVILIGNPEILKWIKGNDQQHSRIGVMGHAAYPPNKHGANELGKVAKRVAEQFSDEQFAGEIDDLVSYVATRSGRLRSVRKNVILARELAKANGTSPREAFRTAHRQLVRDYMLPEEA
jgi:DNA transposition AAA+ family ATPase